MAIKVRIVSHLLSLSETFADMLIVRPDTQSWYHSQEVNVMVDSPAICSEWQDAIRRVQNTHLHRVGHDGVWRDAQGVELADSTGVKSGVMGMIKGVQGSIARVRGKGGF